MNAPTDLGNWQPDPVMILEPLLNFIQVAAGVLINDLLQGTEHFRRNGITASSAMTQGPVTSFPELLNEPAHGSTADHRLPRQLVTTSGSTIELKRDFIDSKPVVEVPHKHIAAPSRVQDAQHDAAAPAPGCFSTCSTQCLSQGSRASIRLSAAQQDRQHGLRQLRCSPLL